jgi:glycosyltransferase involved in cell wall biosynthesis
VAICSHQRPVHVNCRVLRYEEPLHLPQPVPYGTALWHEALQRAERVAHVCDGLVGEGWRPDRILAHSGWGETLGLRNVWPDVPQLLWPELWVLPEHGGYGVDPQKPAVVLAHQLDQLGRNSITAAALSQAAAWVLPTQHQAQSLPTPFQGEALHVIHEGIDTTVARPNPTVTFQVRGVDIDRSVPTLTLVNRNLERMRGFDVFMRALPALFQAEPRLRVIVVGGNELGYGGGDASQGPLRARMLSELSGQLDFNRLYFLGRVPYPQLLAVLQASWVHVYLSYPFVLSWSLLEAMACGCAIVGSRGMPVEEVITHGVEGLLVEHDRPDQLASRVLQLLQSEEMRTRLGQAARQKAQQFDLSLTLPRLTQLIEA